VCPCARWDGTYYYYYYDHQTTTTTTTTTTIIITTTISPARSPTKRTLSGVTVGFRVRVRVSGQGQGQGYGKLSCYYCYCYSYYYCCYYYYCYYYYLRTQVADQADSVWQQLAGEVVPAWQKPNALPTMTVPPPLLDAAFADSLLALPLEAAAKCSGVSAASLAVCRTELEPRTNRPD